MTETAALAAARALLRWYADMGVEEAVGTDPIDWFAASAAEAAGGASKARARGGRPPSPPSATHPPQAGEESARDRPKPTPAHIRTAPTPSAAMPADEAVARARAAAAGCETHEALEAAVRAFDGCALKAGARMTVFADGIAGADLLVIGEAPGREEDAAGLPFVGRAGQLLDKMLAAIGRSRKTDTLISNVVYWRPPGNRTPTQVELAICRPFVDRLIEITCPKAVLLAGGAPTQALLGLTSITRARGTWRTIETAGGARVEALPIFHPAFLLRQPAQKRLAWADLLSLETRLSTR